MNMKKLKLDCLIIRDPFKPTQKILCDIFEAIIAGMRRYFSWV